MLDRQWVCDSERKAIKNTGTIDTQWFRGLIHFNINEGVVMCAPV
jgi:hypothetical protein